jgi:hypothetical protein
MAATTAFAAFAGIALPVAAFAQAEVSVERGLYVSIIAGCHDCHTQGYNEAEGKIDPEKALKGSSVGWRGPWGTTYAGNLRLVAASTDEDFFVERMKTLKTSPPMPWYNVRAMKENDLRSLHRYLISLGEPGKSGPLPTREEPRTPYITIAPPTMPKR